MNLFEARLDRISRKIPAFLSQKKPLLFAHRGWSAAFPENTIPAFEAAIKIGIDVIETDVQLTADNHVVISHDPTVDRLTDAHGDLAKMKLAEIKKLDAGYRFENPSNSFPFRSENIIIPTLVECLELFPTTKFNIDLKSENPGLAHEVWRLIEKYSAHQRVLVGSFHHDMVVRFRKLSKGSVATSASKREMMVWGYAQKLGLARLIRQPVDAHQIPTRFGVHDLTKPGLLAAAHRVGIAIHYWTVDDENEMERLLNLGADGIMSNHPDRLIRVFNNWKNRKLKVTIHRK